MDLSRLSRGERLVLIGSGALLVLSFFPLWAKVGAFGVTISFSGWDLGWLVIFPLILAIVLLVLVGAKAAGQNIAIPMEEAQAYLVGGGIITLLLLIRLLTGFAGASRGILLLISPILGALIAYGGYLHQSSPEAAAPPTPPPATTL